MLSDWLRKSCDTYKEFSLVHTSGRRLLSWSHSVTMFTLVLLVLRCAGYSVIHKSCEKIYYMPA